MSAQQSERFNKIFQHDGSQNIRGVLTTETGYLLVSDSYEADLWGSQILALDFYGDEIWRKSYRFYPFGHGVGLNSVLIDSKGDFWFCGWNGSVDSSYNFIFKFSQLGDSLFLSNSKSETYVYWDMIESKSADLVITGAWINDSNYGNTALIKCDTSGIELWSKSFDFSASTHEYGRTLVETPDGGFIIGALVSSLTSNDSDPWIIKTDSQGNMEWNRLINNSIWNDGYAAVHMGSDGFIYVGCGSGIGLNGQNETINKNYFAKISLNNEMIWERAFGPVNASNPIAQIMEDRHGNIIGVADVFFDLNGVSEQGGLLLKVSPEGDSLWSKTFIYEYNTSLVGRDYCWSLDTTMDGGIITGGFVQLYDTNGGYPFQDVWAVKFDSNGCFDDVYSCPVGIEEISTAEYRDLKIWPNPNDGRFSIEKLSPVTEIQIIDVLGRSTPFIVEDSYSIKLLETKPGIYFIHILSKEYEYCGTIMVSDD
ncbi:MAG: hypothetical protein Kow0075_10490 [Salibacteraceae bacterium]